MRGLSLVSRDHSFSQMQQVKIRSFSSDGEIVLKVVLEENFEVLKQICATHGMDLIGIAKLYVALQNSLTCN